MPEICIKVVIVGRVQGVGFRYSVHAQVKKWGNSQIKGYVRNLQSGEVEALFQGPKPIVEKLLKWCESGPSSAVVNSIQKELQDSNPSLTDFEIQV